MSLVKGSDLSCLGVNPGLISSIGRSDIGQTSPTAMFFAITGSISLLNSEKSEYHGQEFARFAYRPIYSSPSSHSEDSDGPVR